MNNLNQYINEKLQIGSHTKVNKYNYYPQTKNELLVLIDNLIHKRGKNANLNDIDVSNITDMYDLFYRTPFNGDISKWDVSNVKYMHNMFRECTFTGGKRRYIKLGC